MKKLYTASAEVTGGRNGHAKTSDGLLDLELRKPKEMGGPEGKYTNPEQLFACGYGSCFLSALNLLLEKQHLPFDKTKVDIDVHLNEEDNGYFISVEMNVYMPGIEVNKAKKVLHEADKICPYSKAIRNNVHVNFTVHVN